MTAVKKKGLFYLDKDDSIKKLPTFLILQFADNYL